MAVHCRKYPNVTENRPIFLFVIVLTVTAACAGKLTDGDRDASEGQETNTQENSDNSNELPLGPVKDIENDNNDLKHNIIEEKKTDSKHERDVETSDIISEKRTDVKHEDLNVEKEIEKSQVPVKMTNDVDSSLFKTNQIENVKEDISRAEEGFPENQPVVGDVSSSPDSKQSAELSHSTENTKEVGARNEKVLENHGNAEIDIKTKDTSNSENDDKDQDILKGSDDSTHNAKSQFHKERLDVPDIEESVQNVKSEQSKRTNDVDNDDFVGHDVLQSSENSNIILQKKPTTTDTEKDSSIPGSEWFDEAERLLHKEKKDHQRAYQLLAKASDVGHVQSMEKAAYAFLLGDHLLRNITKSVELYHALADRGSPIGQQGLGFLYGSGTGVDSSQAKALVYTTFAALGGDTKAQMNLAYRHWGGIGVVQNCESALTYYRKVSKKVAEEVQPIGSAAVHRIRLYDELEQGTSAGNLDDDLLQYYQFLADKGDVQAQVGLGQLYFQGGRGVDIDHQKAMQYFKQAAISGNSNAQAYLGKMYLEGGPAVEQDNTTAHSFFTKAADQGNPLGQSGLGLIFVYGSGVDKDYGKALSYFNLAAEQGLPEAQLQLGNLYYHGLGVNRDYQRAVKYFTLASQSGNVLALYNLASMHANGNGVMRSCHTATELFKSVAERGKWSSLFTEAYVAYKRGNVDTALLKYYLLAELGYEAAQSNVAYILDKVESSLYPKNETFSRALLQWSRAASQGYTVARVKVGDYHFYGLGTAIDYELAALHYRLASEQQSNAQAMFNLGYMHEQGLGLKKDIHLAKRFYDMAAESSPDAQVPVTLALVKLAAYFTLEWANQNYKFWQRLSFRESLGNDWDLYVITALAVALGLILLIRRR